MEKPKTWSCYGHVCVSKTRREDDKRITVDIFSVEGYMCDVALHCYIRRPAYSHAQKIIVALPPCFCLSFVLLPS